MATWVKKHLATYVNPDLLGLKEQQQLGFNFFSEKENVSAFIWEESCGNLQSKHALLLRQLKI